MTALAFVKLLARLYAAKADDEFISIGHWTSPGMRHPDLPDFHADVRVSVGELQAMSRAH